MNRITLNLSSNNWLEVKAPPEADDLLRSIAWAGRHQSRTSGAWLYPNATPRLAAVLIATIANGSAFEAAPSPGVQEWAATSIALADAASGLRAKAADLPPVPHERMPSYPHQKLAHHLLGTIDAFMAAWSMRTGKTKFLIDAILNHNWRRSVIGCPNKIVPVWEDHFKTHAALDYRLVALGENVKGGVKDKAAIAEAAWAEHAARQDPRPLIFVVNYESMWRPPLGPTYGARNRIVDWGWILNRMWDLAAGDESHRFGKHDSKISRFMERLGTRTRRRVCLSGTPFSHSPLDVFGQYRFLDPTIFGAFWGPFRDRYALMRPINALGGGGRQAMMITGYTNLEELEAKFHSIATVVRLEDVMELPAISDPVIPVALGPKERRAYHSLWNDFVADLEGGVVTVSNALARVIRCQQITSGFAPVFDEATGEPVMTNGEEAIEDLEMSKRAALVELLSDLDPAEPVPVFCRFRRDLQAVHEAAKIAGRSSCELSGRRNDIGARWEPTPGQVAAIQIQSGKEGLDLAAAAYSVVYSTGCPSVGDFDQLMARQLGPRQKRPVTRYHLVAQETLDPKVYRALTERRSIIEEIMNAGTGAS